MSTTDDLEATKRRLDHVLAEVERDPTSRSVADIKEWRLRFRHIGNYKYRTATDVDLMFSCEALFKQMLAIIEK